MSVWSWSGKGKATDFRTQDEFSEWMCTISKKISIILKPRIQKAQNECRRRARRDSVYRVAVLERTVKYRDARSAVSVRLHCERATPPNALPTVEAYGLSHPSPRLLRAVARPFSARRLHLIFAPRWSPSSAAPLR